MNLNMHGYSEKEWIEYIDGQIEEEKRLRFEKHLGDCSDCLNFHNRMIRVEQTLQETGLKIRKNIVVDENQINIGLAKVLARILDKEAAQHNLGHQAIRERLEQLEDILAVMCGSWTAVNALRVAAEGTIARTPGNLNEESWIPFLNRLKKIAGVFCGDTGAKLVWEYGQL